LKTTNSRKLLELKAEGKLPHTPGLWQMEIRHEDWCGFFCGHRCNSDPTICFLSDAEWRCMKGFERF
jgi:hypothetical protein